MKNHKGMLLIIVGIVVYIFMLPKDIATPVEQCNILSGIGIDLVRKGEKELEYNTAISSYIFNKQNEVSVQIIKGNAKSFALLRENLETDNNYKYVYGHEKVILIGEEYAKNGIRDSIDKYFNHQDINDLCRVAVCKGLASDIMSRYGNEFTPASEFMDKLMKFNLEDNFFSDDSKLIDVFVRIDGEGRNVVLPYIDIEDGRITITGIAIFNKDRMVKQLDLKDARIINCLRNNESKGQFILEEGEKSYTAITGSVKRKVGCEKDDEKFKFIVNLDFHGDIVTNLIYTDMLTNENTIKEFEEEISKKTEEKLQSYIDKNKSNSDYLELGVIAAAKFGRRKVDDWGKVIENSDVRVNVKIHVDKIGQGLYNEKVN